MNQQDYILVSAPNAAGEEFLKQLSRRGIPTAVMVNNQTEYERICSLGADRVIRVNTADKDSWKEFAPIAVAKIYLFEKSLNLCCRYAQMCRSWTKKPIYVITGSHDPRLHYKKAGVNKVIHTIKNDISTLIADHFPPKP
ncbi:hypothetical protein [Paenibacillus beijingensis]|uniref:Response regulatory domain-containing protein n=1 Tax=Paenibacillus beijingensis TaxID=1126833 RepID=A0A0D5NN69_9BACL|nr:hypothetical protein [Paenibacillus beijingensis]AJY76744.1 hypothetical protein VN24_21965 [Paenibacillus beijingensis]